MSEIESDLYAINVNNMVEMLSKAYISLMETNTPFKKFPSVMLWGPPGVGKSQGVREIARETDKSVAYNMPKALANRLCHFEIKGDSGAWHDWAVKNGVHEFVVGYIKYNSA